MTLPYEPQFTDHRKTISCKEKGREYIGRNPLRLKVACYRPEQDPHSQGKACDFLLEVASEKAIFVELKGVDLATAYTQVLETCKRYRGYFADHAIRVRIICRGNPNPIPSSRMKLDQYLRGWGRKESLSIRDRVLVRSNKFEEDI